MSVFFLVSYAGEGLLGSCIGLVVDITDDALLDLPVQGVRESVRLGDIVECVACGIELPRLKIVRRCSEVLILFLAGGFDQAPVKEVSSYGSDILHVEVVALEKFAEVRLMIGDLANDATELIHALSSNDGSARVPVIFYLQNRRKRVRVDLDVDTEVFFHELPVSKKVMDRYGEVAVHLGRVLLFRQPVVVLEGIEEEAVPHVIDGNPALEAVTENGVEDDALDTAFHQEAAPCVDIVQELMDEVLSSFSSESSGGGGGSGGGCFGRFHGVVVLRLFTNAK